MGHESDDQDSVDLEIRTAQATVQSGTYPRNSAAELLPSGVFIREIPSPELLLIFKYRHPQDKVQTCVYPWTSRGYGVKRSLPTGEVEVVTPAPMLEVIQHGFDPTPLNPILAW